MSSADSVQPDQPAVRQSLATFHARQPRKRTLLNGKLVYSEGPFLPDGSFTVDCSIRDISEGGAKVVLDRRQILPPELYLIVVKYCTAHWAKLVWLKYPARGLQFYKTYKINEALPEELKFLRKLWDDLSVRSGTIDW